jgi:dipeptidyl aminopeptidase/acylaminoacyl peptidase
MTRPYALSFSSCLLGALLLSACGPDESQPGCDDTPTPAAERPTGKLLFSSKDSSGFSQVHVTPVGSTAPGTALTTAATEHVQPSWSKDGRRITFVRRDTAQNGGVTVDGLNVYVMNSDGSGVQKLYDCARFVADCAWPQFGPDGNIWFSATVNRAQTTNSSSSHIFRISPSGGSATLWEGTLEETCDNAYFRFHGAQMLWTVGDIATCGGNGAGVYLGRHDSIRTGAYGTKLTPSGAAGGFTSPTFNAAGTRVLFGGPQTSIYSVKLDGSDYREEARIGAAFSSGSSIAVTGDDRWVIVSTNEGVTDPVNPAYILYAFPAVGNANPKHRITLRPTAGSFDPSWSAD